MDDDFIESVPPITGVPSPCINVCRLNPRTGWCEGCGRTGAEIAEWPTADDARRREILAGLASRRS